VIARSRCRSWSERGTGQQADIDVPKLGDGRGAVRSSRVEPPPDADAEPDHHRLTEFAAAEPGEKPRMDKLGRIRHLQTLTAQQFADLSLQRSCVGLGDVTSPMRS
jgi:hypothetical protein